MTAREEIQRLFQSAGLIHGDEIPVRGTSITDLNIDYFDAFFTKQFDTPVADQDVPLETLFENMNLMKHGELNIAGVLLFAKTPTARLPTFIVKAISYLGTEVDLDNYIESKDIEGRLSFIYEEAVAFCMRHIRYLQGDQGVNSQGIPEIPKVVFEELIANALIHRDYFILSPVRLFFYSDRIEIISPGHLPNNLTIENIKRGNSNIRNPILASFAAKILPYRGLGSGIIRALKAYPLIEFENDKEGNQFIVTIQRKPLPIPGATFV